MAQQPPVPKPRHFNRGPPTLAGSAPEATSEQKRQLVRAFDKHSSNAVTSEQIRYAKECITAGVPDCYQLLPFDRILEQNRVRTGVVEDLQLVSTCSTCCLHTGATPSKQIPALNDHAKCRCLFERCPLSLGYCLIVFSVASGSIVCLAVKTGFSCDLLSKSCVLIIFPPLGQARLPLHNDCRVRLAPEVHQQPSQAQTPSGMAHHQDQYPLV